MYEMAQTVFKVYGKLEKTARSIESMISKVALSSFSDRTPCEISCERVCELIERKNLLVNLKVIILRALKQLDGEDLEILSHMLKKNGKPIYFSQRSFFRKKNLALKNFENQLEEQGLSKQKFIDTFVEKIHMIGVAYDEVVQKEKMKKERALKLSVSLSNSRLKSSCDMALPMECDVCKKSLSV